MQRFIVKVLGLSFLLTTQALASESTASKTTVVVEKIYAPAGYDENDMVDVVYQGYFSDGCRELSAPNVAINTETHEIEISPISYETGSESCVQMIAPFVQVVSLGKLPSGEYHISIANDPEVYSLLTIAKSTTENSDDFRYPQVDFADLIRDKETKQLKVIIKGQYPKLKRGCMKTTKAIIHATPGNVVVVQPISEIYMDQRNCSDAAASSEFSIAFRLPFNINGDTLLHVRSANGRSYNKVIK